MSHDATPLVETTEDGSLTLFAPTFGEHYHSTHGAVQESLHIYIGMALEERLRAERGATEPSDSSRSASERGLMRSSLGSEPRRSAGPYITIP